MSEARNADIDQFRVVGDELFIANAQPLRHTRAKVFNYHINSLDQLLHQRHGLWLLQIKHQAFFVSVHDGEQGALAVAHRTNGTVVVTLRRFHLDDLSTEISQQCRGQRTGQDTGEIKDSKPFQGASRQFVFHQKSLVQYAVRGSFLAHF